MGEGGIFVKVLVGFKHILYWSGRLDDCCTENATSKVAAIRDEVDVSIKITLHLFQTLTNLGDVLVLEGLVDAQVIVAPREMSGGSWLLASACRTRNSIDADAKKLNHTECVMYRTVSNDFTEEEVKTFDYDMLIFFSPAGIESLTKNFPDFKQGDIAIATFGPATAQAARDAGLRLDIEAPTEKYPSMTGALQHYLIVEQG